MTEAKTETRPLTGAGSPASREMSWWPTVEFLDAVLAQANVGPLPYAGTPAWCGLDDGDPRKLLALAAAGAHHVLRMEATQIAMADASREISSAGGWSDVAQTMRNGRGPAYIPRREAS